MKAAVNSLLQLNLKRFRVPQKTVTRYSALDVMKQALELLYEFSPSERNYREAMRTITVYSEGDEEMLRALRKSFSLIANAVYNAFSGQRHAESLSPEILFLEGLPFDPLELQQSFRFVGVRPPEITPPSVKKTVFLDVGFQPYKLMLEGKLPREKAQAGREEHWARVIQATLHNENGTALIRAAAQHLEQPKSVLRRSLNVVRPTETGKLPSLLEREKMKLDIIHRIPDVNKVFGKK
jgi:hypothetical protein